MRVMTLAHLLAQLLKKAVIFALTDGNSRQPILNEQAASNYVGDGVVGTDAHEYVRRVLHVRKPVCRLGEVESEIADSNNTRSSPSGSSPAFFLIICCHRLDPILIHQKVYYGVGAITQLKP